jgi:hypothetical protein
VTRLIIALLCCCWSAVVLAQDSPGTPASEIEAIAKLAKGHTHDGTVRGDIAKLLGLSSGDDLTVQLVALASDPAHADLFFCFLPHSRDVVMAARQGSLTIYWFVKDDGLSKTAYAYEGKVHVVDNDVYRKSWMEAASKTLETLHKIYGPTDNPAQQRSGKETQP